MKSIKFISKQYLSVIRSIQTKVLFFFIKDIPLTQER